MIKAFIGSDSHCGHRVGLTPPAYSAMPDDDAFQHLRKEARQRDVLWRWFVKETKAAGPYDIALINGDTLEGKGARTGGTELITSDRDVQCAMAATWIQLVGARDVYLTHGTPAHVGDDEDWEAIVAERCKAKRIESAANFDICGLQVAMRHHIGNTSSPPSRFTALSNAQIKQILWALRGQQPQANLILRSHVHRCLFIGEPGLNFQAWTTPALQGLGSKYGVRRVDGLPVEFGFLVLYVEDARRWRIEAHIAPIELQKASVTVIR